ncbi:hypothetical protein HMPREF9696_01190 [Afipia clevelandensis ATCC 49720]|uniref:DUF968 domain-containing protein n=1 Tax=Afipia clevelandensis ATCC 49720 TaxID=883079 RepID=K8PAZ7_9BRAD|nr:hypothetical protein HMPREF9696_01190 [Afipia clevelandensis ATCC 49720]
MTNDAKLIEQAFSDKMAALQDQERESSTHPTISDSAPNDDTRLTSRHISTSVRSPKARRKESRNKKRTRERIAPGLEFVETIATTPFVDAKMPKIDKSELALSEPRRLRDKVHLRFVASQPCLICERSPSDAHHLRFAQPRAMGRKTSDEFTVPLCRAHHRENHRTGREEIWWQSKGIEPLSVATELWRVSRSSQSNRVRHGNISP